MQDIMEEDKSSNTSCIGRVIHTLTTPGLITRTYTPQKHCQTSTFLTPLRLDDQQYKRPLKLPEQILIPSSHWLFNTSQCHRQSIVHFVSTTQIHSTHFTICSIAQQCPTLPPQFSSHPVPRLPSTVLATPLMLSPLPLLKTQLIWRWLYPTNK